MREGLFPPTQTHKTGELPKPSPTLKPTILVLYQCASNKNSVRIHT